MIDNSDFPMSPEAFVWTCVALTFTYYLVVAVALHWRAARSIEVTSYEPPSRVSPALAAYLLENGRCERAFAAALVSLAATGYLKIYEEGDHFALRKLNKNSVPSALEEVAVLDALFPASVDAYQFSATDTEGISRVYREFEKTITEIAEPELISRHWQLWYAGLAFSMLVVMLAIWSLPIHLKTGQSAGIVYLGLMYILSGGCFVATLRAWPATLRKLFSFLPATRRPTLPLNLTDAIPVCLTVSALFGFGLLASATSNELAVIVSVMLLLTEIFRHIFEAPTIAGRKTIEQLKGFREFLSRADADRMNRENRPGHTPETLQMSSGYAVALKVGSAWCEEFTGSLIQFLQMERAYNVPMPSVRVPAISGSEDGPIQLNINSRR